MSKEVKQKLHRVGDIFILCMRHLPWYPAGQWQVNINIIRTGSEETEIVQIVTIAKKYFKVYLALKSKHLCNFSLVVIYSIVKRLMF